MRSGHCPKCDTEIVMDVEDGEFYIYCPNCGPIPELSEVTELSHEHHLGYPSGEGSIYVEITGDLIHGFTFIGPKFKYRYPIYGRYGRVHQELERPGSPYRNTEKQFLVAIGGIGAGFDLHGPFERGDEAVEYAAGLSYYPKDSVWFVQEIEKCIS